MRILVTGASGQVGSATAERLRSRATVIATDRAAFDLSRPDRIAAILDKIAPELIVNAAAYTAVDRAEEEPDLAMLVNAEAPGVMARWCALNDVPLIHFSTDYVFDGLSPLPWSEDDRPAPISVYGTSKLAGETEILAASAPSLIIRISWIYAANGVNFLRKISTLAKTNPEMRVVADQIGAPTSAAFVAEILSAMLENGLGKFRDKAGEASGLVHLAASGEASWYEFATEIVNGLRSRGVGLAIERIVPIRTEDYRLRAPRPLNSRFNLHRLQEVFGIKPPHWRVVLEPELDRLAQDFLKPVPPGS